MRTRLLAALRSMFIDRISHVFSPQLTTLDDRVVPAHYLWNPTGTVLSSSTLWSSFRNWDIWSTQNGMYVYQTTTANEPGPGDDVVFDANPGSDYDSTNSDCVVDVAGGVTVRSFVITNGYSKSLILTNPLTISDDYNSRLDSEGGAIHGSAIGAPAARGTLNITNKSKFYFVAGDIENTIIDLTDQSAMVINTTSSGSRNITGSDIYVNDGCKLDWGAGNINVLNPIANSHITITSVGEFNISANGYTWGMSTYTAPAYFGVHNRGTVTVNSPGRATIVGNYDTTNLTRIESGDLLIYGLAEQTGGVFELRNDSRVTVGGPHVALRIYGGTIIGSGVVDANLTLGTEVGAQSSGSISPGIDIIPASPGAAPNIYGIGKITVVGGFHIFNGGVTIDYDAAGSYDKIVVQGPHATLTGNLQVRGDDKYRPAQPVTMAFLTAAVVKNDFTTFSPSGMAGWMAPNGMDMIFLRTKKYATSYVIETHTPPRP